MYHGERAIFYVNLMPLKEKKDEDIAFSSFANYGIALLSIKSISHHSVCAEAIHVSDEMTIIINIKILVLSNGSWTFLILTVPCISFDFVAYFWRKTPNMQKLPCRTREIINKIGKPESLVLCMEISSWHDTHSYKISLNIPKGSGVTG